MSFRPWGTRASASLVIEEVADPSRLDSAGAEIVAAIRAAVVRDHGIPVDEIALVEPRTVSKTSSGKVLRRGCRDAFQRGELRVLAHATSAMRRPRVGG